MVKIFNFSSGRLKDTLFFVAIFSCALGLFVNLYHFVVGDSVYPVNKFIQYRIFALFSLISAFGVAWLVPECRRRKNSVLAISGVFVFLSLLFFLLKFDAVIVFGSIFVFLFSIVCEIWADELNDWTGGIGALVLAYVVLVLAIFSPFVVGNYINYESTINFDVLARFGKDGGLNRPVATIDFSKSEYPAIHQRLLNSKGVGFYYSPLPIVEMLDSDKYQVSIPVGDDLAIYCIFTEDVKCKDSLGQSSGATFFRKRLYLTRDKSSLPGAEKIRAALIIGIDDYLTNKNNLSSEQGSLLKLMMTRGVLSHHYSYIYRGLQDGIYAVHNQYGLGPALIVRFISFVSGVSLFDSIYYSIFVCNLLVIFFILLFFRNEVVVVVSAATALLVVFFTLNIVAPYLYFIRYLPVFIIVCLLVFKKRGANRLYDIFLLFSFLVLGGYNKEYALLVAAACIFSFVLTRSARYIVFPLVAMVPPVLSAVFLDAHYSSSANILAIFSGVGIDSVITFPVIIWFLFLSFFCYFVLTRSKDVVERSDIVFLCALNFILSIKVAWTGSTNHIGPLFLIIGISIVYFSRLGVFDIGVWVRYRFVQFCFVSVVFTLPGLTNIRYFQEFSSERYVKLNLSERFLFASELADKARSLQDFKDKSYFLLSKQDDFLQMQESARHTGMLHNVSTQINHPFDISVVMAEVAGFEYLVVDKDVLNSEIESRILLGFYNINSKLNNYIIGYIEDVYKMRYLYDKIVGQFEFVSSNEKFILFKRKRL